MKKIRNISIVMVLFLVSCSKEKLNEIDTNPNIIIDAPLNTLLPAAHIGESSLRITLFTVRIAGARASSCRGLRFLCAGC